jgi:hypothetical protein
VPPPVTVAPSAAPFIAAIAALDADLVASSMLLSPAVFGDATDHLEHVASRAGCVTPPPLLGVR